MPNMHNSLLIGREDQANAEPPTHQFCAEHDWADPFCTVYAGSCHNRVAHIVSLTLWSSNRSMIDKRVQSITDIVAECPGLTDGAVVLIGGFGDAGVPEKLIDAVLQLELRGLTLVSNNAGSGHYGLALLLEAGCVAKVVCSFPRSSGSVIFEGLYAAGKVDLEIVPQGTLAERIRAGGAGIPAFYTATAYGTPLADGKETREFDGRNYVMEHAIHGNIALIHADQGDRWGNLTYPKTSRNFNPIMATAAHTTLAEVRRFVDAVDPEVVVTPGIFVDRMVEVGHPE